ncbi:hypothetical protein [Chryseobacterium sp. CT-SW4]|uniref:hypothetical protein n=1 Tax=Chryseobacterium sp. SW-1 TaxID=3157343 RepID=UPI003B029DBB
MRHLFLCLGILCLMLSCQQSSNISIDPSTNNEIKEKITQLYNSYGNGGFYQHPASTDLFSNDLTHLIEQSQKIIGVGQKNIQEKPALMEGTVFVSLPEGFTAYKIKSVDILKSIEPIGSIADVTVEFENTNFSPTVIYTDKVRLVNCLSKGWKVDNIVYDPSIEKHSKDIKTVLGDFIAIHSENPDRK